MSSEEIGPARKVSGLDFLTPELMFPLDPTELAQRHTSGELQSYAVGQHAVAVGYVKKVQELSEQLALAQAYSEDARYRYHQYVEAAELARATEDGK